MTVSADIYAPVYTFAIVLAVWAGVSLLVLLIVRLRMKRTRTRKENGL